MGARCARWLGVIVPLLRWFLAGMIAVKEGFASPYYGADLVLLAVARSALTFLKVLSLSCCADDLMSPPVCLSHNAHPGHHA